MFVELHEGCFPRLCLAQADVSIAPGGTWVGGALTRRGDGPVTHILLVLTITSHIAKSADTFRLAHSPPGSSPRIYVFMGPDKMSALFGKCLSFRDFVLRMAPVPINDPVCILKSAELLSGKRE